ncbi:MAG: DUF1127 domain-containing protein [Alphaproteobacteria bacterium]|jgi:uncharacterized protein YjiS (DUF1127 family)
MSTTRRHGPRGRLSENELHARLHAFGMARARLLRAVAARRALYGALGAVAGFFVQAGERAWTWQNRYNARHHMAELDAHLLDDVGLSRADIMRAASKPFWRV